MKTNWARRWRRSGAAGHAGRLGSWLLLGGLISIGLTASACQASVQADANVSTKNGKKQELRDFDRPLEAPPVKMADAPEDFAVAEYALLGARHDLSYVGPKKPSCQCLAVSLQDKAPHPAFQWALGAPRLEPSTQWVIALSSKDVACDAPPPGTLGASYNGYTVDGNDVVVHVEALGEGRPMTSGAIIPRPLGGGSVFVESTGAAFGKPLEGKGKRCKITPPVEDVKKP
jgi:hypothetical protein